MKMHFIRMLALTALCLPLMLGSAESARSEWMKGYVKMENADKAVSERPADALGLYREALEGFERVRRRYPTWNESLISYRIKYCREQIEKLGQTAGQRSQNMKRDELLTLSHEQYQTIARLNEERKTLQSRVEVLTESLEKARGEAARNAGIETSLVKTAKANDEMKEMIRVLELKLRESQKDVERLKAQEGLGEELKKTADELKLTAEQLKKTQETLTQTRAENETLTRENKQRKQAIDSLTKERKDQDMAMNVVRELSTARKKENEGLLARFNTLQHQKEDLEKTLEQKNEELKRSADRLRLMQNENDDLREKRTAEVDASRKQQVAELAGLREVINQLLKNANGVADGKATGVQKKTLEGLSRQLEAKDAEMSRLAGEMAALFGDRERMMAQEEELAKMRKSLAEMTADRDRQRGQALTSQENHLTVKGECERLKTRLEAAEKRCKTLTAELEEARNSRVARNVEKTISLEEFEQMQTRLKQTDGELAAARKRLEDQVALARRQEQEARQLRENLDKVRTDMGDKAGAVEGMTKVVADATAAQEREESENKKLRQRMTVFEGQLRESDVKVRTMQKLLEDVRKGDTSALARQIALLTEQRDTAEKRVRALEDVLADGDDRNLKPRKDESVLAKENEALTRMNEALTRQNRLLQEQSRERQERIAQLSKETRKDKTGTAVDGNAPADNDELIRLQAQVVSLKSTLDVLNAELDVERVRQKTASGQNGASEEDIRKENQRRERERQALLKGYIQQGLDAERQGKIEAARWNYNKVLSMQSNHKTALQRLGQLAYRQGDDATAIRYLKQAFYHDPDDPETLFALGYSYARQSQPDWAVATMGRAVALNPDNASMARVYGATLVQLGWNEAAEREFRRALKLDPKEKDAAFNLAVLLLNSASEAGHGLTRQSIEKMRSGSAEWLKTLADSDKDKARMVSATLDWLDFLARQADSRTSEAKQLYKLAKDNGMDPDPALEKVLK